MQKIAHYVYHVPPAQRAPILDNGRTREAGNVSRAIQLLDSTILLIVTQTWQRCGRWHVADCSYSVIELRPSRQGVPVVVTDRLVYRLSARTNRPRGYRLMTVPETSEWHKGGACWNDCQHAQEARRQDGLTYHIERNCTARCRAVQEMIAGNAISLGITEERLRAIARRRHSTRRFRTHDGDTLRAVLNRSDGV